MSNKSIAMIATMGIDIGKNSFNVVGLNQRGAIVMRQKWSRPDRSADCQHAAGPDWHGSVAWKASAPPPRPRRSRFPQLWQKSLALRNPAVWP